MSERPLTVRLEDGNTIVSRDDSTSWMLDESAAGEVRALCTDAETRPEAAWAGMSAAARGSLSEARQIRPVEGSADTDSLPGEPGASTGEPVAIGRLELPASRPLREVLSARHSEREFEPPSLAELASVLVRAGRLRAWRASEAGQEESRALPSAGARHPIELETLTGSVAGLPDGHWKFDPARCTLTRAERSDARGAGAIFDRQGLTAPSGYTAIFVVARFERTLGRYPAGATLVWRDAGVVLGGLHLCASDLGLASCIVGCTASLRNEGGLEGVDLGALVLGRRP